MKALSRVQLVGAIAVLGLIGISVVRAKPATARCMASRVACRIFSRSISSALALAIAQASANSLISISKASRRFSDRFLESAKP